MLVSRLEKFMGIEVYATKSLGVGGIIRQFPEDFMVEEVLVDGSKAEINYARQAKPEVLGSSQKRNRYLLCVMIKRNWDTFLAVKAVAQRLGVNSNRIQIAGIKMREPSPPNTSQLRVCQLRSCKEFVSKT